ncbi:recombinase family protein [Picosynechococcus sp. PCC 73109]|uniref:recombinase family protein n=1 Tax=Picosynechococcus sp. PCC 73109 TaxID=374982 RepID=UPI0007457EF7|nr:recombinase family protein [Picosynechococcus sp. PCC 73109]AMA10636.1 recombinase [Picosynechococcus sp. PCC 73109]AMA10649.1 recombinase [Picosynechococcus sp. PCC 73109]
MKAIGYIRVSTEEQATQGVSLDAQKAKLEAYAGLYDIELVDIIIDAGQSAKSLDRPGLQKALGMLDSGEVEAMVIVKLDRLTRSVKDLDWLLENYFADKFSLMSVSEQVDTRTASGRLVLNVLMSVAQWERETIGERTSAALQHKKSQGEHIGGVGFGYEVTGKKLAKTKEHKTVEAIQKLRNEGKTLQAIADHLNSEGIKTQRGGRWYPTTVANIIKREERLQDAG